MFIRKKFVWIFVVIIFLVILAFYYGVTKESAAPEVKVEQESSKSKEVIIFKAKDVNNKVIDSKKYQGKIIIINFWATWCPACKASIPGFISLYKEYKDQGLEIIGITVDSQKQLIKPFIKKNNINYPIMYVNNELLSTFGGVTAIPTTFIMDKQLRIYKKLVGYDNPAIYEEIINKLL